jgi:cytidine deaminase
LAASDKRGERSTERRVRQRRQGDRRTGERRSGVDRRLESGWEPVTLDSVSSESADESALVAAAIDVRTRARARFSQFQVGAALETADGQIVTGCNVENATYGLTVCAERVAVFKAISEGHRQFVRIAVVADTTEPTPPCGACRQILWEFGGDLEVILGDLTAERGRLHLRDLFPFPFDARLLGETPA